VNGAERARGIGAATFGTDGPPHGGPSVPPADTCLRRAVMYEVLTLGFREPSAASVEAFLTGELVATVRECVAGLEGDKAGYEPAIAALESAAATADSDHKSVLRDLLVEHARLFTGPGKCDVPCYASQYLDGATGDRGHVLNRAGADFAAAAYRAEGVALASELHELPDHVAIELEFLYHLCRREEAAWEGGQRDEATRVRRVHDAFLRDHAAVWLRAFSDEVRSSAQLEFYRAFAELLSAQLVSALGRPRCEEGPQSVRPNG